MKNCSFRSFFSTGFPASLRLALVLGLLLPAFSACSNTGVSTDATYTDKNKEERYKYGSLASESGGFSLLGDKDKKKSDNGLGVNGYLWRAALDTISFMPIASADPFGGVITTDWYAAPETPGERVKLNILILDRELRADGVKVTVFRQTKDGKGEWADAPVAAATGSGIEETILTRARQLRLAQKEGK